MRVPLDLVSTFGRTHINRSLKTTSLPEARRIMMRVGSDLERSFDDARAGLIAKAPTIASIAQPITSPARLAPSLSIREAYDVYLADPSRRASPKSNLAYSTVADVIVGLLGADLHLDQLTRKMCRELMADLTKLPRNAKKRWPGLSPRQAIDRGEQLGLPPISIANANGYLNKFCAMLNWGVKEELLVRNPALGLRLADPIRAKDKRKPFSLEQLQTIFNAPLFTGCLDDEHGYAKPGPNRPRRARFWVPFIGLFSGARLNEICQLDVHDVATIDGI